MIRVSQEKNQAPSHLWGSENKILIIILTELEGDRQKAALFLVPDLFISNCTESIGNMGMGWGQ